MCFWYHECCLPRSPRSIVYLIILVTFSEENGYAGCPHTSSYFWRLSGFSARFKLLPFCQTCLMTKQITFLASREICVLNLYLKPLRIVKCSTFYACYRKYTQPRETVRNSYEDYSTTALALLVTSSDAATASSCVCYGACVSSPQPQLWRLWISCFLVFADATPVAPGASSGAMRAGLMMRYLQANSNHSHHLSSVVITTLMCEK